MSVSLRRVAILLSSLTERNKSDKNATQEAKGGTGEVTDRTAKRTCMCFRESYSSLCFTCPCIQHISWLAWESRRALKVPSHDVEMTNLSRPEQHAQTHGPIRLLAGSEDGNVAYRVAFLEKHGRSQGCPESRDLLRVDKSRCVSSVVHECQGAPNLGHDLFRGRSCRCLRGSGT